MIDLSTVCWEGRTWYATNQETGEEFPVWVLVARVTTNRGNIYASEQGSPESWLHPYLGELRALEAWRTLNYTHDTRPAPDST